MSGIKISYRRFNCARIAKREQFAVKNSFSLSFSFSVHRDDARTMDKKKSFEMKVSNS